MVKKKRSRHIPSRIRNQLLFRCAGACESCSNALKKGIFEIHHIKPFAKGGAHTLVNLIILCPNCHSEADRNVIPQQKLKQITGKFSAENKRIKDIYSTKKGKSIFDNHDNTRADGDFFTLDKDFLKADSNLAILLFGDEKKKKRGGGSDGGLFDEGIW